MDLQGVLEGVPDTTQFQTLEHLGKSDFLGCPGEAALPGAEVKSMGFRHFGTPGKGSRLHGSAFQDFADFLVC